jgi:hypothetical protein
MGFMDKFKEAREQASEAMASTGGLKGMMGAAGGGNMAASAKYAALIKRLKEAGVETPATIVSMGTPGEVQAGGGAYADVEVSFTPDGGAPVQASVHQSFLPAQLQGMAAGGTVKVKYDPAEPTAALIY